MSKCIVMGVLDHGVKGLTLDTLNTLKQAHVVIGATRTLELFADVLNHNVVIHDLSGHLKVVPDWIEEGLAKGQSVVVLATGDPLCHGIGSYLIKKIGMHRLNIMPNVSTLQLACARVGISWQDAYICSIHTKDAGEWKDCPSNTHGLYPLFKACLQQRKIIVFTSPENSPDRVARMLISEGLEDSFDMVVVENLLQSDECVVQDKSISTLANQPFATPNIIILERKNKADKLVLFGLEDDSFKQRKPDKGLITKREVRAVSISHMQLKMDSTVWDIGAGSGSVGLEAARLCPHGWVYAVEKNEADFEIATSNQKNMGIHHYTLIHNKAPCGLDAWPNPNAVFVGGSGGELPELIQFILPRLNAGGYLVMNFVTIENLSSAVETLKIMEANWSVTQIQVSHSKPILHMHRMVAENPVWIVTVEKS